MAHTAIPMKDRARHAKTHPLVQKGIMNGRHPRSLVPGGELWHLLDESTERLYHCSNGRRLYTVNQEMAEHGIFGTFDDSLDAYERSLKKLKPKRSSTLSSSHSSARFGTSSSKSSLGKKKPLPSKLSFEMQLDGLEQSINKMFRSRKNSKGGGSTGSKSTKKMNMQSGNSGGSIMSDMNGSNSNGGFNSSSNSNSTTSASRMTPAEQLTYLSQLDDTRLHFGATIALQSTTHQNAFFVVHESQDSMNTGQAFSANPRQCSAGHDTILFKIIDLNDLNSFRAVHYDDKIYLQVIETNDNVQPDELKHWKEGSVVGAHVQSTKELPTMPLQRDAIVNSHGGLSPETPYDRERALKEAETLRKKKGFISYGKPRPIPSFCPNIESFPPDQRENICHQSRNSNCNTGNGSIMLGYWWIRPATRALREQALLRSGRDPQKSQGPVFNTDKIYLEQDFFYMVSDDRPESLAKAQNPHASHVATVSQKRFYKGSRPIELQALPDWRTGTDDANSAALAALKVNEPVVERRGVWTLRIATHSAVESKARGGNRQAEKRMDLALSVIEQSRQMRSGGRRYMRRAGHSNDYALLRDEGGKSHGATSALIRARARQDLSNAEESNERPSSQDSVQKSSRTGIKSICERDVNDDAEMLYGGEEFSVNIRSNTVSMLRSTERNAVKKHRRKAKNSHRYFTRKFQGSLGPDPSAMENMEMLDEQPESLEDFDTDAYTVEPGSVTAQCLKSIADNSIGSLDSHTSLWSYMPKTRPGRGSMGDQSTSSGHGMKAMRVKYKGASANVMLSLPAEDPSRRQRLASTDGSETVISGITKDENATLVTNWNDNDGGSSLGSIDETYTLDNGSVEENNASEETADEVSENETEEDWEETPAERKSRLLNSAVSWPINLAAEDEVVQRELEDEEAQRLKSIEDAKWEVPSTPKGSLSPKVLHRKNSFFGKPNSGNISPQISLQRQGSFIGNSANSFSPKRATGIRSLREKGRNSPYDAEDQHEGSHKMQAMRTKIDGQDINYDTLVKMQEVWVKKWAEFICTEKRSFIEEQLKHMDELISKNNYFSEKQKQLKEMMVTVGMAHDPTPEEENQFQKKVFNREETLINFMGNDRLMREMLQSTTQIFEGRLRGEINAASSSGNIKKLEQVLRIILHLCQVIESEHLREKCANLQQILNNIRKDGGTDIYIPEDYHRPFRVHCDELEGAMQVFVQARTWRRKGQAGATAAAAVSTSTL